MADFLWTSLILSVVLTVSVNALFWLFPGAVRSLNRWFKTLFQDKNEDKPKRVRLFFPWKTMIALSVGLTLLLNLGLLILR